ncbi:MAG: DNA double-strand break repair nuclease NurA [Anaerolineae bacterium]|nr:DNA double-strand break repair nuclease NurA [Anaerolineae bacterium]
MVDTLSSTCFADLPDALVHELLHCATSVADGVQQRVNALRSLQSQLRHQARSLGLIRRKADLDVAPEPSVVGIDGSYQIHRLTALDLCAAAAVAVEGTVKEARRYWPEPHHRIWVDGVPHQGQPAGVLRAVMVGMELELAAEAPHDLVLLDGSFASLIIYLNQGVTQIEQVAPQLANVLEKHWQDGSLFNSLLILLSSNRTVAVPKFTSKNELVSQAKMSLPQGVDGKTLATLILEPGEYTQPLALAKPESREDYHLPPPADNTKLNLLMDKIHVIYFRPYGWTAALRLEVPSVISNSPTRLSIVLEGITRQFFSPAVFEPYPLFLADRMVKSLGAGVQVVEQSVAQHIAKASIDVETTLLFLQNYRTEGGRGGTI